MDLITVTDRLRDQGKLDDAGGPSYIAALLNSVPTAANAEHYARIVAEKAAARRLLGACRAAQVGLLEGSTLESVLRTLEEELREVRASSVGGALFRPAAELEAPPVSWLVEGLLPRGTLSVLSGRDKRGKTLLAQEAVRAVLTGQPVFGRFAAAAGQVLACFLDDPLGLTLSRLEDLGVRRHPDLVLADPSGFHDPSAFLQALEEEAGKRRPALVVVDALYLFLPPTRDAANDASRMLPVLRAFDRIATASGAALLLVHHDNKGGTDLAGSFAIRAMAKVILRLVLPHGEDQHDDTASPRRVLRVEGKLLPARSFALDLLGPGRWAFVGDAREAAGAEAEARILEVLRRAGGWVERDDVLEAVRGRREEAVEALRRLLDAGQVERAGSGRRGDPFRFRIPFPFPSLSPETGTESAQGRAAAGPIPFPEAGNGEAAGEPCWACGTRTRWRRPTPLGGGWVCARCHPPAGG